MKPRQPIPKFSKKRLLEIEEGTKSPFPKRTPIKQKAYTIKRSPIKKSNAKIRVLKIDDTDIKGLTLKLDRVFSRWVRLKDADVNGNVRCVVCGSLWDWKHIQNGHYISRSHMSTRFLEDNCYPQCSICNSQHEHFQQPFKEALERIGGISLVAYLELMGKKTAKFSANDLREKIQYYEQELLKLKYV